MDKTPATKESIWEEFRESNRQRKEAEATFKRELAESSAEFDRRIKRLNDQSDRLSKELEKFKENDDRLSKKIEKLAELSGSYSNNLGYFAEEYFFNAFENGLQNFFGEKFDDIEKNMKGYKKNYKDEYDIVLFNGKSIAIVEVKFKAHKNDIPSILRKADTFRINYPDYKKHQIYLGLATMAFYPELEDQCINQGIAVVKQVGDTVVINDKHLKIY